ncbi:MAG: nucleotidyltransferase family protein [Prevotellaceae bacterium]|jgi:NDP-sugar pyrophosphorylase family protein|nr:nucleotidyltransferase family protein [Prevotellaceae bacterium]
MKAMILAAGLGTRLGTLTANRPKALVELNGTPLLSLVVQRLQRFGFDEIIINVHHFAEQIIQYLQAHNNFGLQISISDEQEALLDTGGGIKNAEWFFNDGQPFLVHNVDIISSIDLKALYQHHLDTQAMATLACKERVSSRYFLFDKQQRFCGWENNRTGEQKSAIPISSDEVRRMAFSGIHVIRPELLRQIRQTGAFSIIDTYLQLATANLINGYDVGDTDVVDVGKQEQLKSITNYKLRMDMQCEIKRYATKSNNRHFDRSTR